MLDIRTGYLLAKINKLCDDGGYRIVEENELVSCFTGKIGADEEDVRMMLDRLKSGGYIDIRYAEDGVYCIRPLPEGRQYAERERQRRETEERRRRSYMLSSALGAFIGALLGAAAVLIVAFAL